MDTALTDYLFVYQYTPEECNEENAHKVKIITNTLYFTSSLLAAIGTVGTLLSSLEIFRRLYFISIVVFPTSPMVGLITSVAIAALSMKCWTLSNAHFLSFPEEKRAQLSYENLKKEMLNWPVFANDKSLTKHCQEHPEFGYSTIVQLLNKVNYSYEILGILYHPNKHPIPHLRINSRFLTEKQVEEILLCGFQRGLIIHFTHLEEWRPSGKDYPFAAYFHECKAALAKGETLLTFEASQKLSQNFLKRIIQIFQNRSIPLPLDKIKIQLAALAPKVNRGLNVDSFKPLVHLEDEKIVTLEIDSYFKEKDKNTVRENSIPRINPIPYYQRLYYWLSS